VAYDIIVPVFLTTLPTFSSLLFNHYDVSAMIKNIWGSPFALQIFCGVIF
jgi:hypothetical protein